mgnify:CR=1 FL=1
MPFLNMLIGPLAALSILSYALYTVSPETVQRHGTDQLLATIPFVCYGVFRYLFLVYHKSRARVDGRRGDDLFAVRARGYFAAGEDGHVWWWEARHALPLVRCRRSTGTVAGRQSDSGSEPRR